MILTDDQNNPMSQPTKANIIRAMYWLVKDAMPNDSLFIHFSGIFLICSWSAFIKLILSQGHGGRTPDLDGDEDDGNTSTIC